ncbi:potassium channel family protein [Alkalihalobacterium sp. APHAB7]|uniref:potassium channel family protein n=1 Tax=Alkalihalobacterium sp. APHAB7 TaxID=3402081 RepID=UPI003AAC3B71
MLKKNVIYSLLLMTVVTLIGSVGFMLTERLHFYDALWLTVVSLLTIGYGDISPETPGGKIITFIIIPIGIGLATYILAVIAAFVIEGKIFNKVGKRKMEKKLSKLTDHIIICGYGRVGIQVAKQLEQVGIDFVLIEIDDKIEQELEHGNLFIKGDSREDQTLLDAGIHHAKGLIATLPNDADNVFITLTAKGLNPNVHVICRTNKQESEAKLYRAGADKVINTASIGGQKLAMSLLKPISIEYMETIFHDHENEYNVEEVLLGSPSPLLNHTIAELNVRGTYGITIVAIKRGNEFIGNPKSDFRLKTGDLLIVLGTTQELENFKKIAHSKSA